MITASSSLVDVLKNSASITVSSGCLIEHNWNQMVEFEDSNIITSGDYQDTTTKLYPFKKLYPADSVVKPFRPLKAGINYAIDGGLPNKIYSPTTVTYPGEFRLYLPGVDTYYKYWVSKKDEDNQYLAIKYPRDIITNKIVVKFEISHSIPAAWEIYTTGAGVEDHTSGTKIKDGTSIDIPGFSSANKAGVLTLYYTGSAWSTDESQHSLTSYQIIRTLKLKLTNITGHVGVIELSPRWTKDISDALESFTITKESSSSEDDTVPVGYVSANTIEMGMTKYNAASKEILSYDPDLATIDPAKIYLYRNAELRPFINIYHSGGAYGSSPDKYDKIYQGYFYIDRWSGEDYNDISIVGADGAKMLQDTICPAIVCEQYSITAIFRRLLDSVGFTSYNFNLKKDGSNNITDTSVVSLSYWWTESDITVWSAIQELCKDTQMTAVFDENNVLQFYSRDYLYDNTRSASWALSYDAVGSMLPNIESFDRVDIPTANQVKIIWKGTTTSEYEADSQPLWEAEQTDLVAAGLSKDISETLGAGEYIELKPIMTGEDISNKTAILLSFTGYLAIDDEVIEYDGIEYKYKDNETGEFKYVVVTSQSDILKYQSKADPSSTAMVPTQRYRIKTRGAFGTTPKAHSSTYDFESWNINEVMVS